MGVIRRNCENGVSGSNVLLGQGTSGQRINREVKEVLKCAISRAPVSREKGHAVGGGKVCFTVSPRKIHRSHR